MTMALIWTGMILVALIFGALNGRADAVGAAAMEGAKEAVTLCLTIGGPICLWTGVMEVMSRSGLAGKLADALRPVLSLLFPKASRDRKVMEALSGNVSANLLGLGNAATPLGIQAARGMARLQSDPESAGDELCRLVVLNTASVQLLPVTVASVRAAAGAGSAFDILPAVWLASVISVLAGLAAALVLARMTKS